jgi:hypothetical protein
VLASSNILVGLRRLVLMAHIFMLVQRTFFSLIECSTFTNNEYKNIG